MHALKAAVDGNVIRLRVFSLLGVDKEPADRAKPRKIAGPAPSRTHGREQRCHRPRDAVLPRPALPTGQDRTDTARHQDGSARTPQSRAAAAPHSPVSAAPLGQAQRARLPSPRPHLSSEQPPRRRLPSPPALPPARPAPPRRPRAAPGAFGEAPGRDGRLHGGGGASVSRRPRAAPLEESGAPSDISP